MPFPRFKIATASNKLVGSLMAVGVSASMAGLGTYATFTDTEKGSTAIDSGIVAMTIGADNTSANRLSVAATKIVPGDTIQRAVNLTVDSTTTDTLATIKLKTEAKNALGTVHSSVLDTDTTNGLKMVIERCSVAWTETGTSAPFTYACGTGGNTGTKTTVLTSSPIIGDRDLSSALGLTPGTTNYLVITATLPAEADNTFQNKASTITYAFTGTQRTATSK